MEPIAYLNVWGDLDCDLESHSTTFPTQPAVDQWMRDVSETWRALQSADVLELIDASRPVE